MREIAESIRESARVLLHRGETPWQQRKRRPLAKEARRPAALRRARERARAPARRQLAKPRASAGSSLQDKQLKSRRIRRLFCVVAWRFRELRIISSNARSPIQRSAQSALDTRVPISAPPAQTRRSAPGSNSDSPRSRRPLPVASREDLFARSRGGEGPERNRSRPD